MFMEESSCAVVIRKLFLFWRLYIPLSKCVDPFAWWWTHQSRFQMLAFLPNNFLGFLGFKLKHKECLMSW
jgi:hypothetical protein